MWDGVDRFVEGLSSFSGSCFKASVVLPLFLLSLPL